MNLKTYQKGIIFGSLTALIVVSIVVGTYYGLRDTDSYELLPSFEWDNSSIKALSVQMEERSDYILAVHIDTSIVTEEGDGMMTPYFNYSVFSIHSWYDIENNEQLLEIEDYLKNETSYEAVYKIESEILSPIYPALNTDLQTIENQTDIRNNYWIEIDKARQTGLFHLNIQHIYKDGTMIWIEAYSEKTVFVRIIKFTEYHGTSGSSGITPVDLGEFENGRDKYSFFNKAEIPEFFPTYTNTINLFLEQFYE